jgi:fumarylacetoacetase
MSTGPAHWSMLRRQASRVLRAGGSPTRYDRERAARILVPMGEAELFLPAEIGDYTDFYASAHHATNVGSMFRPDNPLLPNYKWVPIGYHGRASSVVVSGTPVRRPSGQRKGPHDPAPTYGASRSLDYELEIGAFVGRGNALGARIPIEEAESHLFGLVLVNDWSARDVQAWEYQPLGPFLAKSFATTISPWVVTLDALEPFRVPVAPRAPDDPAPLPYLASVVDQARGAFDITVEAWLATARMRAAGHPPVRLSRGSFRDMYWTVAQLLTHHASNGCNLRPGDLLASGTISGPARESRGCLLELTWRGAEPLALPDGETRAFLEDGDELLLRAYCEREGAARIGFGECRGIVLPTDRTTPPGGQHALGG